MTRTLSTILQTNEVRLKQQLHQLERVSGHQSRDIKLSVEMMHVAQDKVHALGLDKHDTTPKELYQVLMQRVNADDLRLERALQTRAATYISAEARLTDGMVHALESEVAGQKVMALKPATAKRLLKKAPTKRVMKALGYRSFDSMLRQEAPALIVATALHIETAAWRKAWLDSYKKLKPADFEDRQQTVADKLVSEKAHTVLSVPEMGTLVVLSLPKQRPAGMVIATMALALQEINSIVSAANYIRSAEVQADFGDRIKAVASEQVFLDAPHMPQALPWQLLQRYFATTKATINHDIFGPYVQATDFMWRNVEAAMARICPALAFWEGTAFVSFTHAGQSVSMNIIDAAINSCNQVAYEVRTAHHAQQSLWHELCLRYLNHESIEQAVAGLLQPQLAYVPAIKN
jgi:hypothetical protein